MDKVLFIQTLLLLVVHVAKPDFGSGSDDGSGHTSINLALSKLNDTMVPFLEAVENSDDGEGTVEVIHVYEKVNEAAVPKGLNSTESESVKDFTFEGTISTPIVEEVTETLDELQSTTVNVQVNESESSFSDSLVSTRLTDFLETTTQMSKKSNRLKDKVLINSADVKSAGGIISSTQTPYTVPPENNTLSDVETNFSGLTEGFFAETVAALDRNATTFDSSTFMPTTVKSMTTGKTTLFAIGNPFTNVSYTRTLPSLRNVDQRWFAVWYVHAYGMGAMFAVIGLYSLFSLVLLRDVYMVGRGCFLSFNLFLLVIGSTRGAYLFIDPYNMEDILPFWLAYFLHHVTFVCLTSSFLLLHFALLQRAKLKLLPKNLQNVAMVLTVIVLNFSLFIATVIVTCVFSKVATLLFIFDVTFILLSFTLPLLFVCSFSKLRRAAIKRQKDIKRHSSVTDVTISGVATLKKWPKVSITRSIWVTLSIAVFSALCGAFKCLSLACVYVLDKCLPPDPWAWCGYELGFRICELFMCVAIAYVARQPLFQHRHRCCTCSCKFWKRSEKPLPSGTSPLWVENTKTCLVDNYYGNKQKKLDEVPLQQLMENGVPNNTPLKTLRPVSNASDLSKSSRASSKGKPSRPTSMIVSENGFIRFRKDHNDPWQGVVITDEDLTDADSMCSPNSPFRTYLNTLQKGQYQQVAQDSIDSPLSHNQSFTDGSDFGFRPPSSINLNASIEEELNLRLNEYNKRNELSTFGKQGSLVSRPSSDAKDSRPSSGADGDGDADALVYCNQHNDVSSVSLTEYPTIPNCNSFTNHHPQIVRSMSDPPLKPSKKSWNMEASDTVEQPVTDDEKAQLRDQIMGAKIPVICVTDEPNR